VTGKKKIVSFQGSYHGINDEVIVRSNAKRKAFPAAPGIMPNSVENMLVLDYGTEESLAIIEKEIGQLAAVLVEPVQSRRPEFVPLEFWRRLRQITEKHGVPLIFDEVITGFRYHPGGVQQAFGVQADLSSYGKVVGGGLPIGMIAGKKRFMDALDGGFWSFGDESIPEVGVTYFAGTFVRHPLAIAAAYATLKEIQITGGRLQNETNARSDQLCKELNAIFDQLQVPYHYCNFGSLMKLKVTDEKNPFAELLPCWLRSKGLHVWDFPSFLTSSHKDEHVREIIKIFQEALQEMVNGGLFGSSENRPLSNVIKQDFSAQTKGWPSANPPQAGARLGKTKSGQPAWFIEDPERPGRYLQIAVVK
jgi:glutamate-1-semialdehyde aminotransferase